MVGGVSPPSEWLEATPRQTSLSGAIAGVALAQVRLLSMIEAPARSTGDGLVVWHVSCGGGGSPILLRLAAHLGVSLATSPYKKPMG